MKSFFKRFYELLTYKSENFSYTSSGRLLSKRSYRILLWVRIVSRIYMWVLALYLIAHFAVFLKRMVMH